MTQERAASEIQDLNRYILVKQFRKWTKLRHLKKVSSRVSCWCRDSLNLEGQTD